MTTPAPSTSPTTVATYNPDYDPTGIEGGVDTHRIPWLPVEHVPGMSVRPLRAGRESGQFSAIVRLERGSGWSQVVHLGGADLTMLSGRMTYDGGPLHGTVVPGVWGYVPAHTRVERLVADEDTEFLANFYGPLAFLGADGHTVLHLLTAADVAALAHRHGLSLVPSTLAECAGPRRAAPAPAAAAAPLSIDGLGRTMASSSAPGEAVARHPHFVDTRAVPWIQNPGLPDIALKILRVSEETGVTSLLVRHNGVAGPHYHLGSADFLVLSGRIGYRAGPPEGYGPGTWFFEPAGARHDATQRIGDDDLIYTANVYGPIQFDTGRGTPIAAVLSWMQYLELARASGVTLVRSAIDGDASLLAWAPLGGSAPC